MNKNTQINERVKLIRIEKGLSREQVASKLNISVTAYGRIERGGTELSISRLEQLAKIFGVDKEELIGVSSNDNTEELLEEIKKLNEKIEDLQNVVKWIFQNVIRKNPLDIVLEEEYREKIKEMGLDIYRYKDTTLLSEENKKVVSNYLINKAMKIDEISSLINSNIFTLQEWKDKVNTYIYREPEEYTSIMY
jgi:transcriptional regulator with XRE-family HTH domain